MIGGILMMLMSCWWWCSHPQSSFRFINLNNNILSPISQLWGMKKRRRPLGICLSSHLILTNFHPFEFYQKEYVFFSSWCLPPCWLLTKNLFTSSELLFLQSNCLYSLKNECTVRECFVFFIFFASLCHCNTSSVSVVNKKACIY